MTEFPTNPTRFDPYKNFKFRVKWDGRYVAAISRVTGLIRSTEVVEHREDDEQDDEQRHVVAEHLDLEPMLRDAVVLDLPLAPVCRDDCPGLCPQCGFRLQDDPEHHHDVIDPRWAALGALGTTGSTDDDTEED